MIKDYILDTDMKNFSADLMYFHQYDTDVDLSHL